MGILKSSKSLQTYVIQFINSLPFGFLATCTALKCHQPFSSYGMTAAVKKGYSLSA